MKILLILLLCAVSVPHFNAIPVELVQQIIPVEVRYEQIIPGIVSREQILLHGRRNLEEKVQLSTDELPQALKHLPIQAEPEIWAEGGEEKLQLIAEEDGSKSKTIIQPEIEAAIIDVVPEKPVQSLPEVQVDNDIPAVKSLLDPEADPQEKAVKIPLDNILSESQKIINDGLKNLKESFTPGKDQFSPSSEQWAVLEKQVHQYFDEQKNTLLVRQTENAEAGSIPAPVAPVAPAGQPGQNNWFQNLAAGVSNIATNFVNNLNNFAGNNNGAAAAVAQGDEGTSGQQPGNQGLQNFVSFINTGFGNLVSTITGTNNKGPTTSNTVLGDSGATVAPGRPVGFFGTVINNVQSALGIQQGPGGSPPLQGDIGFQQQNGGPGQIIQSFGTAISNFFQGGSTSPANAQGDTGTAPTQSNNNLIQNIQNAISNLNPFRPQAGGQNPLNPPNSIQSTVQNIGSQIQQLVPVNGGNSQTPSPNPVESVSAEAVNPETEDNNVKREINSV